MTQILKCVFDMPTGGTHTLSLPDPKTGLTKQECRTFMNEVISEEAIVVNGASPNNINSMYILQTDEVELAD